MIKYSICILTYRRDKLLYELINSIVTQENILLKEVEIIIIDNDLTSNLKEKLNKDFNNKLILRYFNQPIKNLSISRNLAISYSRGEYIIFIDDDEYADKYWLSNLTNFIEKYNVDIVFGNLKNYFEDGIPKFLQNDRYYFPSLGSSNIDKVKYFYTGNCMIKKQIIEKTGTTFDENFGITGGEDVVFFEKLQTLGFKMGYCAEAIIWEFVPKSRGNLKYLIKRNFRYGNSYILRKKKINANYFSYPILFLKSCVKILIYFFYLLFSLHSKNKIILSILKFSSIIGELSAFFNIKIKMYK